MHKTHLLGRSWKKAIAQPHAIGNHYLNAHLILAVQSTKQKKSKQCLERYMHLHTEKKGKKPSIMIFFFLPSYWQVSAGNTANDALDEQRRTTKHPVEKYRVKAKIKMFPCLNMNLMTEWKSRTRKYLARGHYVGIGRGKVRVS